MKRRRFLSSSLASGVAIAGSSASIHFAADAPKRTFKLKYAPHPNMFKNLGGEDYLDQLRFAADQGFRAWEDNGMGKQTPEMQTKIGKTLEQLDMTMGVFVAYASFDEPVFAVKNKAKWDEVLQSIRDAVEIAKRCGAKHFTVVPGSIDQQSVNSGKWNKYGGPRLSKGHQTANVTELLRRCAAVLEPHDLVMVLEPLNWHTNHGGTFLSHSDQAYAICKAVDSPACKILFDIYHQQITEGNIIHNIDLCWDEIGMFQIGDNPGRKEPGTGEINYRNIFKHIHARGWDGVLGMEHGNSGKGPEGEQAVIDAYIAADDF